MRWTAVLGGVVEHNELSVARSLRTRFIGVPALLVNCSGAWILRMPEHWPWATPFIHALQKVRALPSYVPG